MEPHVTSDVDDVHPSRRYPLSRRPCGRGGARPARNGAVGGESFLIKLTRFAC
jgi:hypothetical protein